MPHEDGHHHPARGDKIWDERRQKAGYQPNGVVHQILEYGSEGSVVVHWFEGDPRWNKHPEEEYAVIDTAELDYRWCGTSYRIYADESILDQRVVNRGK